MKFIDFQKHAGHWTAIKLLLAMLLVNFMSCTEHTISTQIDLPDKFDTPVSDRESITTLIRNTGVLHNEGMHAIRGVDLTSVSSNIQRSELLFEQIAQYFTSSHGFDMSMYLTDNVLKNALANILDNHYQNNPNPYWDAYMAMPLMSQVLNSQERNFVDLVQGVFLQDFSGLSLSQVCDKISSDLESIRLAYESATWSPGEGDLAGGLIYLAIGSNEYCRNNYNNLVNQNPSGTEEPPAPLIVQLDCAGYVVGWAHAVYSDWESGNLNPDGQWRRINAGVSTAVGASMGGFKWWKF